MSFLFSFKKTETLFSGLVKLLLNDHSQVIILVMNVSVDSYFEKYDRLQLTNGEDILFFPLERVTSKLLTVRF